MKLKIRYSDNLWKGTPVITVEDLRAWLEDKEPNVVPPKHLWGKKAGENKKYFLDGYVQLGRELLAELDKEEKNET